jgi:hypothetical protein
MHRSINRFEWRLGEAPRNGGQDLAGWSARRSSRLGRDPSAGGALADKIRRKSLKRRKTDSEWAVGGRMGLPGRLSPLASMRPNARKFRRNPLKRLKTGSELTASARMGVKRSPEKIPV